MATPSKYTILRQLFTKSVCIGSTNGVLHRSAPSNLLLQQVRLKGTLRIRAPKIAKEKEKYIPPALRISQKTTQTTMSAKELAEFEARVPVDDVWIRKYYPVQPCTLHEAIRRHCQLAAPEMFNCMDNPLFLRLELDMSTKKKTKFISATSGTVLLPYSFNDGIENRVAVITKEAADQEAALGLGAEFAGGTDLIKKIESGVVKLDEFDYVVLNLDLMSESSLIKKQLKERYPTKKRGNLGNDIKSMVKLFVDGRPFASEKNASGEAHVIMPVGLLSMPPEQLLENCKAVIEAVTATKPATTGPPIVKKLAVTSPPSPEMFYVHDPELLPSMKPQQSAAAGSAELQFSEEVEETGKGKGEDDDDEGEMGGQQKKKR